MSEENVPGENATLERASDEKPTTSIARELFLRAFMAGVHESDAVARIADTMRDLRVPAGQAFFRVGEPPECTYFIIEGEVTLTADGLEPWTFGPRTLVGTIDVMADRPRSRTATAVRDTHLLELRTADWFDILEENFEFTQGTVANVARTLSEIHLATPPDGGFPAPRPQPVLRGAGPLDHVARMLALRTMRLFERAGVQVLASLAASVRERRLAADELLFDLGGERGVLFFVVQGVIEVTFETPPIRALFGPGELVGGATAFNAGRALARAHARGATLILALGEEDYFDEMEEHFDLARSALAYLSLERDALMVLKAKRASVGAR